MRPLEELSNIDLFFYYGQSELAIENESDLIAGIIQPKRSLYYNRTDGCGVSDRENNPNSIMLTIQIRFDIVKWVAFRNGQVSDNNPDRRIAVSQERITFEQNNNGEVDVNVLYIPFANIEDVSKVSVPVVT